MATAKWRGHAPAVAQVKRGVLGGTWANNDIATFTMNGKDVLSTLTNEGNTFSSILNTFATDLNASTISEFAEVTWANFSDTHIQGTADTAGKPFTITVTDDGSGTIGGIDATTENAGPYSANTAANWSTGAMPTGSDDVVFENSDVDCLYDLDALAAIQPLSFTQKQSYSGRIGLPRTNVDGGTGDTTKYVEYRPRYLQMGPTTVTLGEGEGNGSGRIMLDFLANDAAVTLYGFGSREETGIPATLLKGTNTSNSFICMKGDVGVAFFDGESANVAGACKISFQQSVLGDSRVIFGSGVTFGNIEQSGGQVELESDVTNIDQRAGCEMTIRGTATVTLLTMSGTVFDDSSGTITTLDVQNAGDFDHARSMKTQTITNVNLFGKAKYRDPNGVLVETNGIDLEQTTLQDVTIWKPPHKTITFTSL